VDPLHRAFVSLIATDHTALAGFLVEAGIDPMSVGPETFLRVKRHVATAEAGHARVQVD